MPTSSSLDAMRHEIYLATSTHPVLHAARQTAIRERLEYEDFLTIAVTELLKSEAALRNAIDTYMLRQHPQIVILGAEHLAALAPLPQGD